MEDFKYIVEIEAYLNDELSGDALDDFEKRMTTDDQLQLEVASYRAASKEIDNLGLQRKLDHIHLELERSGNQLETKSTPWKIVLGLAASVLVFITVTFLMQEPSAEDLYAENYKPYSIDQLRGEEISSKLIALYKEKNYEETLALIESTSSLGQKGLLIRSICEIELQRYEEALTTLNIASSQTKTVLNDHIDWYKALILIKLERLAEARQVLKSLAADSIYSREASRLLISL